MVKIYKSLLNLFLKANCPLCDRPTDEEVCSYGQRQLQRCQLDNPSQLWQGSLPIFAWGEYGGKLKQAIAAMKYNQNPELARPLGHWLGQAWRNAPMAGNTKLTVVPLPMHPRKRQQRGFTNPAFRSLTRTNLHRYSQAPKRHRHPQCQVSWGRLLCYPSVAYSLGFAVSRGPVLLGLGDPCQNNKCAFLHSESCLEFHITLPNY